MLVSRSSLGQRMQEEEQDGLSLEFIAAIAGRQCYIQDASGRGLCKSETVQQSNSLKVQQFNSQIVKQFSSPTVLQYKSLTVQQSDSPSVNSITVTQLHSHGRVF